MEKIVRNDLISVLTKVLDLFKNDHVDTSKLKELSNHTIHNASIYQDEHSVSLAILIYSLSKIIERVQNELDFQKIKNLISLSIEYLEDENEESYNVFISKIFDIVAKTDVKFKHYVQEVINQASVKKGRTLYEHGLSASKTAEILGISLWDLSAYLGATQNADTDISSVRQRLKYTRQLFR